MKKHPLNANANVTNCENDQKHILHTGTDINDASSNYLNNVPLSLSDNSKSMHNNVVPIKNESTEDTVLNTMGKLTSS